MNRVRVTALFTLLLLVSVASGAMATGNVLLIVGDSYLNASDSAVQKHLEGAGYKVTVLDDDQAASGKPGDFRVILISSTCSSGKVVSATQYLTTATPILNWENATLDDFQLASEISSQAISGVFSVTSGSHWITQGFGAEIAAYSSTPSLHTAYMKAGKVLAEIKGSNWAAVAVADKGEKLLDGSTSPNKRAHFAGGDDAFASITAEGWKLFDRVLEWLLAN